MTDNSSLHKILSFAVQNGASDVHFRIGESALLRVRGELLNIKMPAFDTNAIAEICKELMANSSIETELSQIQEVDGSFDLGGLGRFRFNIFKHDGRLGAVLRVIPAKVPSLEDLQFPEVFKRIAGLERGLVLVTGSTGQGKSTTLAAIIDYLNATRRGHIITIEDPIEFVHHPKHCKITQREVGRDTGSFATALRSALRQDPNIILVGELRDPESIDMALKASETGHTVFSTLHTTDAAKSIGRILSMFPAEEQGLVRLRLADCLKATVSQRLLNRMDGKGRIVAQEIMVANTAIAECIADPKRTSEIPIFIENSREQLGSQTFRQHLTELYYNKIISLEVAKQASANGSDFEQSLNYERNETNTAPEAEELMEKKFGTGLHEKSVSLQLDKPEVESFPEAPLLDEDVVKTGLIAKIFRSVKKA